MTDPFLLADPTAAYHRFFSVDATGSRWLK